MKRHHYIQLALFLLLLTLVSGCKSESETIKDAEKLAKETFDSNEKIDVNYKSNQFSFYLPNQFEVMEEETNNIILNKGDQTYILFYNALEDPLSELNYNSAKRDQSLFIESFADTNRFGYIRIMSEEKEGYELQIGIGGVKITTYTTKNRMTSDAKNLMEIARSIIDSRQK